MKEYVEFRKRRDGTIIPVTWRIEASKDNLMRITRNGQTKRLVFIYTDSFSLYRLEYGNVYATNGALGLLRFIDKSIVKNCEAAAAWQVINYAFQYGRSCK